MRKTALVTGGAGFIGSHLVDSLIGVGYRVVVLDDMSTGSADNLRFARDSGWFDLVVGSVCDRDLVARLVARCDEVYHLAAIASVPACVEHWTRAHEVNLVGTIHVFEAASKRRIPVVYASSAAVYGDAASDAKACEDMSVRPLGPYGADKLSCELQARAFSTVKGVASVGLRFFNVYGPRQDPSSPYSGVISRFADAVRAGRRPTIFGDGSQTRDFVFVSDVVSGLVSAMKLASSCDESHTSPVCDVFNIATGRGTSIRHLAEIILHLGGRDRAEIDYDRPRAGDIRISIGANEKAAEILRWSPQIKLDEGLAVLLDA